MCVRPSHSPACNIAIKSHNLLLEINQLQRGHSNCLLSSECYTKYLLTVNIVEHL